MTGRPSSRRASATSALAAAIALCGPALAQDQCRPQPVDPWPPCSAEMMAAAINPAFTYELAGDVNLEAFAGGANSELLPGRARLSVQHGPGGVAASGAACASHLGAVAGENDAGFSPAMADRIERYADRTVETTDNQSTVFTVFSPNLNVWRGGGMAGPLQVRHGGVGGWPGNSAAQVLIELEGTPPSRIEAGGRYAARAYVSGPGAAATPGGFFTAWAGRIGRVRDPMEPAARRVCERQLEAFRAQMEAIGVPFDDTYGAELTQYRCESDLRLVDGVSRRVSEGDLRGFVEIEAVTPSRVVGRFELTGAATVMVTVHEPERVDDAEERGGAMTISGRFLAPNVRATGMAGPTVRAARIDGDDPEPGAPFSVAAVTPGPDQRNVSWTPDIRLDFTAPIDPSSLRDGAVTLEYRTASGAMAPVDVELAPAAPDQVAVVTADRLMDGVRYRLTARPGGVRSASGAALSTSFTSAFFTLVDLNDDEEMVYMRPGLNTRFTPHEHFVDDWSEGVETRVHQVSADAPLVVNKPTAARVYIKWRPQPDVHEDWLVDEFRTHVRGLGDQEQALFDPQRGVRVRRLDLYDDEDRRAGRNAATLYGWTPQDVDETFQVRVEVEPADQCGEPEVFVSETDVEWTTLQTDLDIAYYIARVGPWRDAVPAWASREARRIARSAADFTTQVFPVTDTRLRFAGVMRYSDDDHAEFDRAVDAGAAAGVRNHLMESTHDRLARTGRTDADIWLLFTPHSWLEVGGRARWDLGADFDAQHAVDADIRFAFPTVQMTITEGMGDTPLTSSMMLVTHEIGHIYGLDHEPYARDDAHRDAVCDAASGSLYPGIEGLRIEPDGYPGFNKSSTEGNAESGAQLLPLMHPCGGVSQDYWITRDHYDALIDAMTQLDARPAQ